MAAAGAAYPSILSCRLTKNPAHLQSLRPQFFRFQSASRIQSNRAGRGALSAKMVTAPASVGKASISVDFDTLVFNKEKITLAGQDEVSLSLISQLS